MTFFSRLLLAAICLMCSVAFAADSPIYSLDQMTDHPYRFTPAYGHASQNLGSPKWFRPGYGYVIPGYGANANSFSPTPYSKYYKFGIKQPGQYSDATHRYWTNEVSTPWYLPGSSTNLQDRFSW